MSERCLQFSLEAGQSLPIHLAWRVSNGYLRATGQTEFAEIFTMGIWGPDQIVMPELLGQEPIELRARVRWCINANHLLRSARAVL